MSILTSTGVKWKQYKNKLTRSYIKKFEKPHELLKHQQSDLKEFQKEFWSEFVAYRLTMELPPVRKIISLIYNISQ